MSEYWNGTSHWEWVKSHFYHIGPNGEKYLTFEDVIKRALQMFAHREWYAYLYGTDGQTCDDVLVDRMVKKYPGHFVNRDIEAIKAYSRGKVVFDCSGFIHSIFGAPDFNSSGIIQTCDNVSEDLAAGPEGSVLYKPGHIGIDIGHGCFIDIAGELDTFRLKVIREYDWKKTGTWNRYCDYNGSTND